MTNWLNTLFVTIIFAWLSLVLSTLVLPFQFAAAISLAVAISALVFSAARIVSGFTALMDPIGVVLPLLALRHILTQAGFVFPSFSNLELSVILIAHATLLCSAAGLVKIDLYRWGYRPWPVAIFALSLCAYAYIDQNPFWAILAVLAQILWLTRLGSSNYFDHVTHATLFPAIIWVMLGRLI